MRQDSALFLGKSLWLDGAPKGCSNTESEPGRRVMWLGENLDSVHRGGGGNGFRVWPQPESEEASLSLPPWSKSIENSERGDGN